MGENERCRKEVFAMLGGVEGVKRLANCFYDIMSTTPEAKKIRSMHPQDLTRTRENFSMFLCGWLGGPSLYRDNYGAIDLTAIHALFDINIAERDTWLSCMSKALDKMDLDKDCKDYLNNRFTLPADKIRLFCQRRFPTMSSGGMENIE